MDREASQISGSPTDKAVYPCPLEQKKKLRIALRDFGFELYTNLDYELEVEGKTLRGNSGATGVIEHPCSPGAQSARLLVWTDSDPATPPTVWNLKLDDIDPIAVDSGAETRFHNLAVPWRTDDPRTVLELEEFQAALQVKPAEAVDSPTRAALARMYSATENPSPPIKGWEAPKVMLDDPSRMAAPPKSSTFLGQLEKN